MSRKHKKSNGIKKVKYDDFQFDDDEQSYLKSQNLKLKPFLPRTKSQKEAYEIAGENTLTFLKGPAGTGKTIVLCRLALDYLSKGLIKKIVVTRPAVESGPKLGYMPGSSDDKMAHYLVPILDNFLCFIEPETLKQLVDDKVIECVPIGFCRGRTFNNAFLIIDEGQNLTHDEFYNVITRIGFDAFGGMTYDADQLDIPQIKSCVSDIDDLLGYEQIGDFEFGPEDVVRSEIVKTIIYARNEAKKLKEQNDINKNT